MTPSIGRIVIYTVSEAVAEIINWRRAYAQKNMERLFDSGAIYHMGSRVNPGDQFAMIITRVLAVTGIMPVCGTVFLDGSDTHWAAGVGYHEFNNASTAVAGMWSWPDRGVAPGEPGVG